MTTRKHASRTLQTRFAWKTQRHGLVDPASPASDMITKPFCPSDVSTLGRSRRHPAQGKTAKACHKFQISEAKHVTGVCFVLSCLVLSFGAASLCRRTDCTKQTVFRNGSQAPGACPWLAKQLSLSLASAKCCGANMQEKTFHKLKSLFLPWLLDEIL